ncbi:integrin alpha-M-like [Protopterus annectens]|uniref:integrin alpha-M-like n=1 Tax=Protopterus annectens TaxID=7888 RepID=UPI001CF933DB|nr:integrin alpha-M-like [Protopterus annectens]
MVQFTYTVKSTKSDSYQRRLTFLPVNELLSVPKLQFKQNCGEDNICTDYLRITFNFSGFSSVIIGRHTELNLTVNLQNDYEDSSYTVVHFFYPLGLSFRKVNVPEASRHIPISCVPSEQPDQNVNNVVCGVSTPSFPAGSKIIFSVAFGITAKSTWGEKLVITANVTSNNKDRILNESAYTNEIPIQHAVALILIRGEESTHYINFSAITPQTKAVEHIYVVENLQEVKNLPVTLTFSVAVALGSSQIWNITNVSNDKDASCKEIGEIHENCSNMEAQQKEQVILDFQNVVCKLFQCSIISLGQKEPHHFRIKGNVSSSLISQHVKDRKLFLASSALVEYNRTKYVSMFGQEGSPLSIEILTEVEIYEEVNNKLYAAGIIGGLVLLIAAILLLRKCGFFERHYKNKVSGQNEELSPENESPTTEIGNMTSDKTASGQE